MPEPKPLHVLVVGSGGREHTLALFCAQSPLCEKVSVAPGNAGIARQFPCHPVPADDIAGLVQLAVAEKVDYVVVGPEVPLSLGLVDALGEKGIPAFGPQAKGAQLEASKVFTKDILEKHRIPTARSATFTDAEKALEYLKTSSYPVVLKADGLAAGKGVTIAANLTEATQAIREAMQDRVFGSSGDQVLIEEFLVGEEASIHLLVSGSQYLILPTSQDHKRIGENDTGPNTGGMGAYSPAELVTPEILAEVDKLICRPSVEALEKENLDFRGTLYIGIMLTPQGPKVLEFNVRFGDPETQVILPRLANDPLELMLACTDQTLDQHRLRTKPESALCVVLAAAGYPGTYRKGDPITLPTTTPPESWIFLAGVSGGAEGEILTSGGRVIGVSALAPSLRAAADAAYDLCDQIHFTGKTLRRDIGAKQLRREEKSL